MYEVVMPRLSDSMEEGKIIKWKVKAGDAVREGDVLAEIESDKAVMELECFRDGRIAQIVQGDGAEVAVGQVIATIAGTGEEVAVPASVPQADAKPAAAPAAPVPPAAPAPAKPAVAAPVSVAAPAAAPAATPPEGRIAISPYARKLADSRGIDYTKIKGTGPHGRIMAEDIEQAARTVAQARPPKIEPAPVKRAAAMPPAEPDMEPLAVALVKRFRVDPATLRGSGPQGMILVDDVVAVLCARPQPAAKPPADEELPALEVSEDEATVEEASFRLKTQARRVTAAKHVIPHFYVTASADVTRLLERRGELKVKIGATVTHLVMLACLKALHGHPEINCTWDRGRIIRWKHVNLGLAVEAGQGLTVAVLPRAEDLPLAEIVTRTAALVERAREGHLTSEDRRHPTFVISSLGMYDVEEFQAILNPPASVTLAVASAMAAPVIRDGGIYVGKVMRLTASCDHRVIDGVAAARFLQDLSRLLENPETLLEGAGA
jgi:pyruvate dehydrogenase E2 component (dihydrolipoamide acetyltransferase)